MQVLKRGLCQKCRKAVPAEHSLRNGKVFLVKHCPECGVNESLVSNDARAWQHKRDIWHYEEPTTSACNMRCERCQMPHEPTIVFVDVTNRCNMNCPICIANIRGMGFEFHPPLSYFEKIFEALAKMNPRPQVELFGGEPTLRDDLLEIIMIARKYGMKPRIVTNGLKLADEAYCKTLCEAGVRVRLAFDGRNPEIYKRLRRSGNVYEKKLKALENLARFSRRKSAILCCAARKINDSYLGDLVEYCHEHQEVIDSLGLIPLTENWDPDTFETDVHTTREDVEHMIEEAIPGGEVEFVPAGIMHVLRQARSFLRRNSRSESLMFGGVHPDCELITLLTSDGQRYVSVNKYLKRPLSKVVEDIFVFCRRINEPLAKLDPAKPLDRWRGKLLVIRTFLPLALRTIHLSKVFRGGFLRAGLGMLGGLLRGRRSGDVARQHMNLSRLLRVAVLPFEELHSIDAGRLQNCKAVFAYVDADTDTVRTIPACSWTLYRNDVLGRAATMYGIADRAASPDACVTEPATATPAGVASLRRTNAIVSSPAKV